MQSDMLETASYRARLRRFIRYLLDRGRRLQGMPYRVRRAGQKAYEPPEYDCAGVKNHFLRFDPVLPGTKL